MILSCDLKFPKIEDFHFRFHFCFLGSNRKNWGISNISNIEKWGISNYSHVINFKTEKAPKMKFFDFGAFQINEAII